MHLSAVIVDIHILGNVTNITDVIILPPSTTQSHLNVVQIIFFSTTLKEEVRERPGQRAAVKIQQYIKIKQQ